MSATNDIYLNALDLAPEQREELALVLLESLPADVEPPIQIDPAYEQEILRRIERINRGETKMLTPNELLTRLRQRSGRPPAP
jgi:hypothetical protein